MKELELSVMGRNPQAVEELKQLLSVFENRHSLKVDLQVYPCETGRSELVKVAMYHHGLDVSEIGTTWLGDLIGMNSLRPFSTTDLAVIGGCEPYVKTAWERGRMLGDPRTWAVPWLLDANAIYYRRDLLKTAGINESAAFQTPQQFEKTVQQLQASGVKVPLTLPLHHRRYLNVHNIASWIWAEGGDLLSQDGKRVLFNQPEAHAGLHSYFSLYHYLVAEAFNAEDQGYEQLFREGVAAITLGSTSQGFPAAIQSAEARNNMGAAVVLGASFVGGSNLVVWKHTRYEEAALALVSFLNSVEVQNRYCRNAHILPVRLESLAAEEIVNQPVLHSLAEIAAQGRTFPCFFLWGLVEEKLDNALSQIWISLMEEPSADLDEVIRKNIDPLAARLNVTLGQGGQR
jgi:multiple sugar transport system substrate-binding protein